MKYEFTEQELRNNIRVPKTVEERLRTVVDKCLTKGGVYHQLLSRIKSAHSLAKKYSQKNYNEEKKIQDLIGIRINLYFEDDLQICKTILETLFGKAEWSLSEVSEEEIKPTKINGVFRLPEDLKRMINDETWNYYIDDTFEIQLKTVFFEGWHEIEHDMKYKGEDLWSGKRERSRYFNTILATLELCDKSIVTLFENLGHDLYHEKNWAGMIKAHFRIKLRNKDLYPELQELFDNDTRVDNTPKRIFKTKREDLIFALLALNDSVELNVNTIVAVLNNTIIHDPEVTRIMDERDVFGVRAEKSFDEEYRYELRLPEFSTTFHADVVLKGDDYEKQFDTSVNTIYSWLYNKFSGVMPSLDEEPGNVNIEELGFRITVTLDRENRTFTAMARHVDDQSVGRVWVTSAVIVPDEEGRLRLTVDNGFTYYTNDSERGDVIRMFSCPRFYRQIATQIGVVDVLECAGIHNILDDSVAEDVLRLAIAENRSFPMVFVISSEEKDGKLDESWLGNFAIRYIQEKAGHYAHFARVKRDRASDMLERVKELGYSHNEINRSESGQGILVVHPKKKGHFNVEWFDAEYITNCSYKSFEAIEHLQPFKRQDNGRAFGNELLQVLRRINTDYDPYIVK